MTQDDEQLTIGGMPINKRGGPWHPDTPDNRWALEQVMAAGNETYGDGTHWIEEREA